MLWDKGVGEYVEAAQLRRQRWPQVEFCLLGFVDVQNPAADCVVLPSYREGTPRTLLEAAAMALPIITTNAVGCREVVDDGVNGYLCQVRDAKDLAYQMEQMRRLSSEQRTEMGLRGRAKMEAEFDEQIVIGKYLAAIAGVTQ